MVEKSGALGPEREKSLEGIRSGLGKLRDQNSIYRYVLEEAAKALRAEGGTFFVCDLGMAALIPKASIGTPMEKLQALPFRFGVGICGWVAHNGESLVINDVTQDPRFNKLYDKQTGYVTKSVLCAPMPLHGDHAGVIELINHAENRFGPEDLAFLERLSGHAASALEKSV